MKSGSFSSRPRRQWRSSSVACLVFLWFLLSSAHAGRTTLSLDGIWSIEDGKVPDLIPATFSHTVPVPGMANLAKPGFPDVDKFISRENLVNRIRSKTVPDEWLTRLQLDPAFADYLAEAFKPLGVFINFFQPSLVVPARRDFTVMMVNDESQPASGTLTLALLTETGAELARSEQHFELPALGDGSYVLALAWPDQAGKCVLKATAQPDHRGKSEPTVSRRWVTLQK